MYCFLFLPFSVFSQKPVMKVDIDQSNRREAEVNEPDYIPFPYVAGSMESIAVKGIKVSFKPSEKTGSVLTTDYYKAGIQSPYYARLSSDGLVGSSSGIEMRISGLPAGDHTLLTYHNQISNEGPFSFMSINLDGNQIINNLMPSHRVKINNDAKTSYITVKAIKGKDIVVIFSTDKKSSFTNKDVIINGFEINTPNPADLAKLPNPKNGDEHVDADNGTVILSWTGADEAVSHDVYIGNSFKELADADRKSPLYRGNQEDSSYDVKDNYSMLTYYWRIDELASDGKITKGTIWKYRPRQLAFSDAEGYGRYARGGRGGKVVAVTNLNDDGPGSFRYAVNNDIGPRTIVFNVSGIINLKSRLVLNQNYVTVAGQTAPGKGITIRSAPFGVGGNDVIVRFMRVRLGAGRTFDGMGITGANHSIMDHSSISWTIDEAFSSRGAKNMTLQRTLISEALNVAGHQNYPKGKGHGYAATIGGDTASFHHNLLAHCYGRNWSLGGGLDGNGYYTGKIDIRNNVVYNWGTRATDGGANQVNFVNNYYKPGAATKLFVALNAQHENVGAGMQRYYFAGNIMPGYFDENSQEKGRKETFSNGDSKKYEAFVDQPFFEPYVKTQSAKEAYKNVLSDVGSNQPVLDDHDNRIINETLNGTYKYKGSVSGIPGHPDSHEDVGGWEDYPQAKRDANWDTDQDGLPNWWEKLKGLNVNSATGDFSDTNADNNKDGFTNLDNYLEWMATPYFSVAVGKHVNIALKKLSKGYTAAPVFKIANIINGKAVVDSNGICKFSALEPGLASFNFTVTDAEGSTFTRKVNVLESDEVKF